MTPEYLCKCNNCGALMYDENPEPNHQPKINTSLVKQEILPMEQLNEEGDTFWGCGNCKTDAYLQDVESILDVTNKP